jgi:hypothetical protein
MTAKRFYFLLLLFGRKLFCFPYRIPRDSTFVAMRRENYVFFFNFFFLNDFTPSLRHRHNRALGREWLLLYFFFKLLYRHRRFFPTRNYRRNMQIHRESPSPCLKKKGERHSFSSFNGILYIPSASPDLISMAC